MYYDVVGQKFGMLTVIGVSDKPCKCKRDRYLICQCECGNIVEVISYGVVYYRILSCGCIIKDRKRSSEIKQEIKDNKKEKIVVDIKGEKFDKLTAIELTDKRKQYSPVWKCQCECGNIVEVTYRNLKSKNTKSCGCLRRTKSK